MPRHALWILLAAVWACGPAADDAAVPSSPPPIATADPPATHEIDLASEPIDLARYRKSVFSQFGEDGVLEKVFEVIEPTHRYAIEFGAADGVANSNVRHLTLEHGWGGLQIEGDPITAAKLEENYRDYPRVQTLEAWVWPGNIELLFEDAGVPKDFDLLVIDIDSNDYYVWRAIHAYRPKVVMIEAHGSFPPPEKMVVEFHPMNYWDGDLYAGASLQSLYELGQKKGYELIYHYGNAIFVDAPYFPRFGLRDNSPTALFESPFRVPKPDPLIHPDKTHLIWKNLRIEKKFRFDR